MNGKGYKAILILVVGLTAFSSALKELNQIREYGAGVNQFVAEWSEKLAPAESPSAVPPVVIAKLDKCQSKVSAPDVDLPWLEHVADAEETTVTEETEAAPPVKLSTTRAKRERLDKLDPVQFEVRILNDQAGEQEVPAVPTVSDFPAQSSTFKFKSHKQGFNFRISPRDRELLKTLNRGINLRIAG
jgi:hypothetical protein